MIVVHGGPAAAGSAAPLARALSDRFFVVEPWQRGSGGAPLTVQRHVEDLRELVSSLRGTARPAVVGESWGAMLALCFAAAHPHVAGPIALVGCGTFDEPSRRAMQATIEARTDDDLRRRLERLPRLVADPADLLVRRLRLLDPVYQYDALDSDPRGPEGPGPLDVRAHTETWDDMLRLQREGVYPAALAAIDSPVLMLHGDHDPHPGEMIRRSLEPHLRRLEVHELARCGHQPWRERHAREPFFRLLRRWLERHAAAG